MPRGPKGEKRPADVIGNAVHVMRIATGEIEDTRSAAPKRAKGGKARARALSPEVRSEIARTAATGARPPQLAAFFSAASISAKRSPCSGR
jgi:hypothetical protein